MKRLKNILNKLWPSSLAGQMIAVVLLALVLAQLLSLLILGKAYRTAVSEVSQRVQFQAVDFTGAIAGRGTERTV